ncbi:hypothetical protein BJ170DRAFT_76316 [Xylariales sp. AK1849]|nr:hypothetical protein BJ170DRAFT_76316 [Xylariales sp. AK1849]
MQREHKPSTGTSSNRPSNFRNDSDSPPIHAVIKVLTELQGSFRYKHHKHHKHHGKPTATTMPRSIRSFQQTHYPDPPLKNLPQQIPSEEELMKQLSQKAPWPESWGIEAKGHVRAQDKETLSFKIPQWNCEAVDPQHIETPTPDRSVESVRKFSFKTSSVGSRFAVSQRPDRSQMIQVYYHDFEPATADGNMSFTDFVTTLVQYRFSTEDNEMGLLPMTTYEPPRNLVKTTKSNTQMDTNSLLENEGGSGRTSAVRCSTNPEEESSTLTGDESDYSNDSEEVMTPRLIHDRHRKELPLQRCWQCDRYNVPRKPTEQKYNLCTDCYADLRASRLLDLDIDYLLYMNEPASTTLTSIYEAKALAEGLQKPETVGALFHEMGIVESVRDRKPTKLNSNSRIGMPSRSKLASRRGQKGAPVASVGSNSGGPHVALCSPEIEGKTLGSLRSSLESAKPQMSNKRDNDELWTCIPTSPTSPTSPISPVNELIYSAAVKAPDFESRLPKLQTSELLAHNPIEGNSGCSDFFDKEIDEIEEMLLGLYEYNRSHHQQEELPTKEQRKLEEGRRKRSQEVDRKQAEEGHQKLEEERKRAQEQRRLEEERQRSREEQQKQSLDTKAREEWIIALTPKSRERWGDAVQWANTKGDF